MKIIELFSGIGGMHFALKGSDVEGEVVLAVDINPVANKIYTYNFPDVKQLSRNIQSLSADFLNSFRADTILMSPPCQPFTRNGLKGDMNDSRTSALMHILDILPKLKVSNVLIENVKGFEISNMRNVLIQVLKKCNFTFQEFLLNPMDLGIPNSRLRYYCLAKKHPQKFSFDVRPVMDHLPIEVFKDTNFGIENILVAADTDTYLLPMNLLHKYWKLLDICFTGSKRSCCFTKAYGRYVEGTGSVFSKISEIECEEILNRLKADEDIDKSYKEYLLKSLNVRYFTPLEVSRLLCFPDTLKFPEGLSDRQKYMVLGNSINVKIVSKLINLLK
ncbi:hypothetical protein WA026_010886 [Henosepilachna vigintioctopunctata]|uniref:tRNA (Cytosine(38)-C(5))-methyltransferase n=1 Tax=Henosepilachna vigintioctopunctata TaxID=420089 RepID=A0AAW1V0M7_9CUCU